MTSLFHQQDEKNQFIYTNCWLQMVSKICYDDLNILRSIPILSSSRYEFKRCLIFIFTFVFFSFFGLFSLDLTIFQNKCAIFFLADVGVFYCRMQSDMLCPKIGLSRIFEEMVSLLFTSL